MLVNRPEIVPVSLAWLIDSEWESQVPEVGTYTRETKERRSTEESELIQTLFLKPTKKQSNILSIERQRNSVYHLE